MEEKLTILKAKLKVDRERAYERNLQERKKQCVHTKKTQVNTNNGMERDNNLAPLKKPAQSLEQTSKACPKINILQSILVKPQMKLVPICASPTGNDALNDQSASTSTLPNTIKIKSNTRCIDDRLKSGFKDLKLKKTEIQKGKRVTNRATKDATSKRSVKKKPTKSEKKLKEIRKMAAERKRKQRQRIKEDPELLAQEREKERLRSEQRRATGKIKLIGAMNPREAKYQRKIWREAKNREKKKRNNQIEEQNFLAENTPPGSPALEEEIPRPLEANRRSKGRKKVKVNRAKVYRELNGIKMENLRLKRLAEKWKKKFNRIKTKSFVGSPSPTKLADEYLKQDVATIKKRLVFGEIVMKEIKSLSASPIIDNRRAAKKCLNVKKLKWYKCFKQAKEIVGVRMLISRDINKRVRRNHQQFIHDVKRVKHFLEDHSNSCILPGTKDTITRGKIKKQKCYLLDSLYNLYKKFKASTKISTKTFSYSYFCSIKPFWFVKQNVNKRDTCQCKKCANFRFLLQKLHIYKLIPSYHPSEIIKMLRCQENIYDCMYGLCTVCNAKSFSNGGLKTDNLPHTFYWQWVNKKESRIGKSNAVFNVQIVVKQKIFCSVDELIAEANKQLTPYLKHSFNIQHQNSTFKEHQVKLLPNEIILVVDFAENYVTKYSSEIQSAHYGASKQQLSLHTSVLYFIDDTLSADIQSFCTVSSFLDHSPCAIWAHLDPILKFIKRELPLEIDTLHFRSDGPITQYRNKKNFILLSKVAYDYGFKTVSWSFSEAGHGKSQADGVGSTVKRTADQFVSYGNDVIDCQTFLEATKNLKVRMFEVKESGVRAKEHLLPINEVIKPMRNTMSIHEIIWNREKPDEFGIRSLKCMICKCSEYICPHFDHASSIWKVPFGIVSRIGPLPQPAVSDDYLETLNCDELEKGLSLDSTAEHERQAGQLQIDDYVAVAFEDNWYPGKCL